MRLWNGLKADWAYKLLSLALAALLWVFVLSEQNPIRVERYALELRAINVPSGLVPVNLPRQINVELRVPPELLNRLTRENLRAYVNAEGLSAGQHTLSVHVDTPQGVQVQEWDPKMVMLILDEWIQRTVEVEVGITGVPLADYTYEPNPIATPEQVVVKGPSRDVVQVWKAYGEVDVTGADRDVQRKALVWPLDLSGRRVENVTLEPVEVAVRVRVTRRMETRTVHIVPRVQGLPAPGYEVGGITVVPVTISVRGDPTIMMRIEHIDTLPVNVNGATTTLDQQVALDLPPGVEVLEGEERRPRVRVEIRAAAASPAMTRSGPPEVVPSPTSPPAPEPSSSEQGASSQADQPAGLPSSEG